MEALLVYVTTADLPQAECIAAALLERRAVACVNIIPGARSRFWWEGRIDGAEEVLLIAKTRPERWELVLATLREYHSYQVFDAVGIPILTGNPDYLQWVRDETEPAASTGESDLDKG